MEYRYTETHCIKIVYISVVYHNWYIPYKKTVYVVTCETCTPLCFWWDFNKIK